MSTGVDRDAVVVEVADTGPGMSPEVAEHVFDPSFTTKGVGEGTGLGLDISRRVVERHNGEITVDSQQARQCSGSGFLPGRRDCPQAGR